MAELIKIVTSDIIGTITALNKNFWADLKLFPLQN